MDPMEGAMTQEPAEQPKHNPQKYQRIASHRFPTYPEAKEAALTNFLKLESNQSRLYKLAPTDLTSQDYKVRVKRRSDNGREYFDVVSYASMELFKNVEKKLEEAKAEPVVEATEEKPVRKGGKKDRKRKQSQAV